MSSTFPLERTPKARSLRILITTVALLGCLLLSGLLLDRFLLNQAGLQIEARASQFMDSMMAVREYTSNDVGPIVAPLNITSDLFLPEAVPSYSANRVYSYLERMPGYQHYSYREATLNPTNLKDKADPFEARLIELFRANPSINFQSGDRTSSAGKLHYVARPLVVSKASCLECHSVPERAPRSQISTYGTISGFGWQLGEIVGAQIVSVPVAEIESARQRGFVGIVLMFFVSLVLISTLVVMLIPSLLKMWLRLGRGSSTSRP